MNYCAGIPALGLSVGEAAWRFGVTRAEYRELEAAHLLASFDTYDRICKLYGWLQSFVKTIS
jgi:hypothetical protein